MKYLGDDGVSNTSHNPHFSEVLEVNVQRRRLLQGSLGAAALNFFGLGVSGLAMRSHAASASAGIRFNPISASLEDTVRVPIGYKWKVLYAWGDPISSGPAFAQDASNSAADQAVQAGMHHDGMHFFPLPRPERDGHRHDESGAGRGALQRGLLAINHEYTDDGLLHLGGVEPWTAEKVAKSQAAHGVSVIEVRKRHHGAAGRGEWQVVRPSRRARRITASTPMRLSGPAAGHQSLRTSYDAGGIMARGTLNNCANGATPWGTYLTCEENWNGYFAQPGTVSNDEKRYGISATGAGYRWHEFDPRFNVALEPNEPNRFGWVVEIDPYDPDSVPVKRTALGRLKHEGATTTIAKTGHLVVYMGDDERNEYIYKFVSRDKVDRRNASRNRGLLDAGTLYVAKFNADGSGQWLALVHGQNGLTLENGFETQADICIRTRQAADRAGATMMDRPEWIAVHPHTQEVYCTLTNNNRRGTTPASSNAADGTSAAGSARPPLDHANPRRDNIYGHIIRWREANGDCAATAFAWDIFVSCGDPSDPGRNRATDPNPRPNYAGNINGDTFGSPDGLWFDPSGILWIQTDISTSVVGFGSGTGDPAKEAYANIGNNQMLAADVATGQIRRFLTGPQKCELTGITMTPDRRALFVNIQHPGETSSERSDPNNPKALSSWPDGAAGGRPRSATIVIEREDGGPVGG